MPPHVLKFDRRSVAKAGSLVSDGGLIVYPTDTVYGLGCDPANGRAVRRLALAKGRDDKPIPVLCSSTSSAMELVEMNKRAERLATKFWPGALTIVAPLKRDVPFQIHQGTGTVGVRVPALQLCVTLIENCGGWLTGTSANRSGVPSARSAAEALEQLGNGVDLVLDGGRLEGIESTVVRVIGDSIQVLRAGPVGVADEAKVE